MSSSTESRRAREVYGAGARSFDYRAGQMERSFEGVISGGATAGGDDKRRGGYRGRRERSPGAARQRSRGETTSHRVSDETCRGYSTNAEDPIPIETPDKGGTETVGVEEGGEEPVTEQEHRVGVYRTVRIRYRG